MRPESIKKFDIFFLGGLLVGILAFFLNWDVMQVQSQAVGAPLSAGTLIGITAATYILSLLLWYFVSRRASNIAKWILVVLTLLGLIGLPTLFAGTFTLIKALSMASTLLGVVAVVFLFRPDARAWFAGEPDDSPDALNETFE